MNGLRLSPLAGLVLTLACAGSAAQAQAPALTVALDAQGVATLDHPWTIDKQVTPTSSDRFIGETQQLAFRIALTKGAAEARFSVGGEARITNTTGAAVDLQSISIDYGGAPVTHDCATGSLAAGATLTCPIEFTAASGQSRTLTLAVGSSAGAGSDEATVEFGTPTVVNDSVTVLDPALSEPLPFAASGVHEFTQDVTCIDGNTRAIKNTATIEQTGASDSVSARVACHAIRMGREAVPTTSGWTWDIQKTHAQATPVRLAAGGTFDVQYTITATATATAGGGNTVTGNINVTNTHPLTDATLVSVEAWIDGISATATCPSLTVPRASYGTGGAIVLGRISCPFTLQLPAGHTPKQVTGKVAQQLFDYSATGVASADGTKVLQGSQPVSTGGGETDECVNLSDLYLGTSNDLGQFCATAGNTSVTRNFTGTIRVTADDECAFTVPNLARLVTNDTGTTDQDDTLVEVERTDCVAAEALSLDLEAQGNLTRTYPWTIDKSVTPESSDRFIGETQELAYTLRLTRGTAQDSGYVVSGNASVSNDGTGPLTLTSIAMTYGGTPISHGCVPGTIAAGQSLNCPLSFPVADATPRALVMTVETSGGSTGTQTLDVAFGAPTTVDETITVRDTLLDETLTFSASGTHEYTHEVTCVDGNTRVVDNTATIVETGASDSARARVACHATRMERAAQPTPDTRWTWDIQKTHAQATPVRLAAGGTFDVQYTITATATAAAGGDNVVTGRISAINTNPVTDAQLVSVEAWIDGIPATTNCPSLVVPKATYGAGGAIVVGKIDCPFTLTLPDGHVAKLVTGRVTQQLFDYSATGVATANGTKVHHGSQAVSAATGGETDECVNLSDLYLGTSNDLGQFCATAGNTGVTRNFTGTIRVTADDECAFTVPNLVRLVTNDTGTTDQDDTLVEVERTDCVAAEALSLDLEAQGNLTRTYPWTIDKSVTPESSDRFIGETQELAYTLRLTRGTAQDSGYVVSGNASVSNDGTGPLTLTSIAMTYGGTPISHGCVPGTIAAGQSLNCPLSFPVADATPRALVMTVETSGGSTGTQTLDVAFGAPTTVDETITVRDTLLDETLTFSASGTHEYTHEVTCVDGNTRVVDNTATIVETGASDSARARVACHAIRMERAAQPNGGRSWSWDVQKTHAEATPLQLTAGQTYLVDYTITATATATEGGAGTVTGSINVVNTHPLTDAQMVSVEAWIDGMSADVDCPSLTVPHATYGAGGSIVVGRLVCPFTLELPEGHTAQLVTGRITQQLFDYSATGVATANGTKVLQGSQAVSPASGSGGETDECVRLTDIYRGTTHDLGEFCATPGNTTVSRSFSGAIAVTPEDDCEYEVQNLARLRTNDSGTIDEDTTQVQVERTDCNQTAACVRTQGYWKTHSVNGPAPYDPTWARIGEDTPFFLATDRAGNALGWYSVMWLSPKGNAYFNLAPQFVAATLNIEAGATASTQVLSALDAAQKLFETYTVQQIAELKGDKAPRPRFIELAGVLDMYNNGEGSLGPAHCSEDKTSED